MAGRQGTPDKFNEQVSMGLVPGCTIYRKFGSNDNVNGSGNPEDCWPPGTVRVLPTTAAVASVVSTDIDDTAGDTGARTIEVHGLDENLLECEETVTMNGTSAVTTTQTFLRINRAFVATAGSSETNEGTINISVGGDLQAVISAEVGQTLQTLFTVPSNKTLFVNFYYAGVGRMANGDAHISARAKAPTADSAWRTISDVYLYNGQIIRNDAHMAVFPSGYDVRVQCASSASTQMFAIFGGYLIENNYLAANESNPTTLSLKGI